MGLIEVCEQIFLFATRLKLSSNLGDPDLLRTGVVKIIDEMDNESRSCGVSVKVVENAKYALVALLDELILNSAWEHKDNWMGNSLQMQFFGDHIAGVEFFNRLELIRRDAGAVKNGLLEVYYFCLVFGFEGKFRLNGADQRRILISEVADAISPDSSSSKILSPSCQSDSEVFKEVKNSIPVWCVAVFVLGFMFSVQLVLSFMLKSYTGDLSSRLMGLF